MKMPTSSGVHFIGSDGCHQKHKISWLAMLFITVAIICKHGSVSGVPAKLGIYIQIHTFFFFCFFSYFFLIEFYTFIKFIYEVVVVQFNAF